MKDKVIVSMASLGRENYNEAMLNMIKSCVKVSCHEDFFNEYDYMLRSLDGYCDLYYAVKIKLGSWPLTKLKGVSWATIRCLINSNLLQFRRQGRPGTKKSYGWILPAG